jgi:hypothetical protein
MINQRIIEAIDIIPVSKLHILNPKRTFTLVAAGGTI